MIIPIQPNVSDVVLKIVEHDMDLLSNHIRYRLVNREMKRDKGDLQNYHENVVNYNLVLKDSERMDYAGLIAVKVVVRLRTGDSFLVVKN